MIDVGGDNGAAAGHFIAHELGGQAFARRDVGHLGRDLTLAGVVQLRHGLPSLRGGAARGHPRLAELRQAGTRVVSLRTAGVVQADRFFTAAEGDLAKRHAQGRRTRRRLDDLLVVDLRGIGIGLFVRGGNWYWRGLLHFRSPSAGLNRIRFQGFSQSRRSRRMIASAKADTPGGFTNVSRGSRGGTTSPAGRQGS